MPANINYGNLYTLLANANRSAGRMSYHSGTTPDQIKDMITFIEQGMSPGQAATMASRNVKPQVQPVQEQPVEQATSTPFIDVNADPYAGGEGQPYTASSVDEIIQPAPTIVEQEPAYDPMNTGATAEEIQPYNYQNPERLARIEAMFPPDETPAYETLVQNQPFIEDTLPIDQELQQEAVDAQQELELAQEQGPVTQGQVQAAKNAATAANLQKTFAESGGKTFAQEQAEEQRAAAKAAAKAATPTYVEETPEAENTLNDILNEEGIGGLFPAIGEPGHPTTDPGRPIPTDSLPPDIIPSDKGGGMIEEDINNLPFDVPFGPGHPLFDPKPNFEPEPMFDPVVAPPPTIPFEPEPSYIEEAPAYETLVQNQPFIDINNPNPYAGGEAQPTVADPAGGISEVVDDTGIMSLVEEAIIKRQEANNAVANATNAYEADVAEFKDIEAKEIEDKVTDAFDAGIGSFGAATDARTSYEPVDNWGEPGFEAYIPESEIIDPIQDFTPAEASPFIDTNPFNDVWEAPTVEVTDNVGAGAGGDPTTDFVPINNPFEPVETDYDPARDQLIDPNAPDPGMGWWDDPDAPGPDQDYWDEDEGVYEPPIDIPVLPPPPPPPIYTPPPPPPPMATGPTATPMNRLIAMQTGMFGGQPQGQYRPYEEPSEYTAQSPLNQPAPFPVMHGNRGGSIQQPTRNLKKLFNNPLDQGLGQLPVMGQNDTLTQTVQAGFRPRR
jgi:hypothetical protein